MTNDWNNQSYNYWEQIYQHCDSQSIKVDNWLEKYDTVIDSVTTPILDLGCGSGNDTLYLMQKGKSVIACDRSKSAIINIQKNFPNIFGTCRFTMTEPFPFETQSCELIIADLCLHYFTEKDTQHIIQEINRILMPNGYLLFRVNSVNDINYGAGKGEVIEKNLYLTENGMLKRFFDIKDIQRFFGIFHILSIQEKTLNRYRFEKYLYEVCVQKD